MVSERSMVTLLNVIVAVTPELTVMVLVVVVLLPVMGGREADDGSVRSEQLAAKLPGSVVVDGLEGAAEWVKQNAGQGDLVVCMSCGDLYKAADLMVRG